MPELDGFEFISRFRQLPQCDDIPIIGHAPGSQHLWLSTGHGMMGVGMSAGSGQLLADLITGRAPAIDPTPYRMERFT